MPFRLNRPAAVGAAVISAALVSASAAGAATTNMKVPAEEFPAANLCNGDQVQLQGTLHLVTQGELVEDAPRQHATTHFNSQRLTGIGIPSGERYSVNLVSSSIENSRIDGANVTTLETIQNVVSRGSGENFQVQTVFHVTFNANGDPTATFQNFHVHCDGPLV